jgi:soluble lytic murein transglycosylase
VAAVLAASSCSPKSLVVGQQLVASTSLPSSLTNGPLTLSKILRERHSLSANQLNSALRQFLDREKPVGDDRKEASYILARLLQNSNNQSDLKEALTYFDVSKDLPALSELSLWHISEVASSLGQEKLVRKSLQAIMAQTPSPDKRAQAEYGVAQSFSRANENEKAASAFEKIKKDHPQTPYALGADYYLGEMAIAKYESSGNNASTEALRGGISLFNQYLRSSPTGHFAYIIVDRLRPFMKANPPVLTSDDFDLYGQAAYSQGNWQEALGFWQKGKRIRLIESAMCFARLGTIDRARSTLIAAIKHSPGDYRYVSVANEICNHLKSPEAIKFWRQIQASKPQNADAALWNIGKRSPPPASFALYRELLNRYPNSSYAPESQWWVFWDMVQHKKGKDLLALVHVAESAAQRYSTARAAPRFLFWAGKVCEKAGAGKQAETFYRKTISLFPTDYYGYRSQAHLAALHKSASTYGWGRHFIDPKLVSWTWPEPTAVGDKLERAQTEPFWELVRLKEYQESLDLVPDHDPELSAWLYTRLDQPRQAITAASLHLPSAHPTATPLWQYSYPLLYAREIQADCKAKKNVDACLAHALIREESNYNRLAVSSSKAIGLTQVMPGTAYGVAKRLNISVPNQSAFFDPALNLELGIDYFSICLSRFHDNQVFAVASYNGGAGAVHSWLNKQGQDDLDVFVENIPFRETRDYVRKVFRSYWTYCTIYQKL